MSNEERICVGAISGPHGVRGQIKLIGFTANPKDITSYGTVSDETGNKTFKVKVVGTAAKGRLIASIEGVDDRDKAEALKGTKLYVLRSALPEPEEDEYYHADLIGLTVQSMDGDDLGTIRTVLNHGAGDILEVELADGEAEMVPFTKASVPLVDIAAQRVLVDPPEGIFESLGGDKGSEKET
ncbi:MAG: ribosome maturation factor RimM [Alphaproteobacteria bacterium]|nr:ribosome maturation factor RimM [Alphaproteobacteria bacterium]